jgi:hypothetical protein
MQQRFRKLALFVGAATLASGGLVMVACSTDNGGTTPTPAFDGGGGGTKEGGGGGGTEAGMNEAGPQPDGGGADADCSKNPVLRDNTAGFRCAFLAAGAGGDGGASTCAPTETCCNTNDKAADGGFEPAFCASAKGGDTVCMNQAASKGSTYATGAAWECADKSDCTGGQVCCMIQDPVRLAADPVNNKVKLVVNSKDKVHPVACNALDALNAGGSRCKATCDTAANDIRLCSKTDDGACGAGTTCTPFYDFTHFVDRGACH